MKTLVKIKFLMKTCIALVVSTSVSFFLLLSTASLAEDIELYISDSIKKAKARPQVLIIFDNSGSMSTKEPVKNSYEPNKLGGYPTIGGLTALPKNYIYYTKGGTSSTRPIPDSPTESRRFLDAVNGCQTARDILDTVGFYTGHIREYTFNGNSGSWQDIPDNNGENINLIDCQDDVIALNDKNAGIKETNGTVTAIGKGYPVDGKGDISSPKYHTDNVNDSNASWTGPLITLYTADYLRWHQSTIIPIGKKSRLDIAKESVTNLIYSSPYVDFGLQVFNRNTSSSNNGGRIVHGIQETTLSATAKLVDIINNDITASTNTPLCETLYEASLYFSGKAIDFGNDYDVTPKRDKSIEDGSDYKSPFSACADTVYVILITDGSPTQDGNADTKINNMPEGSQTAMGSKYQVTDSNNKTIKNMLPPLAEWMLTNDINSKLEGKQNSKLYTIGFGSAIAVAGNDPTAAELLLKEAAEVGGGDYFYAGDTASLTESLTKVLENLDPSNDSLTSASVAANNFDQTQTLESVYYAMFQPDRGPRWQGNVKKYRLDNKIQKGKSGKNAVTDDGYFNEEATSYWSSVKDGNTVNKGGVAGMLQSLTSKRNVYSDLGANGSLVPLNRTNAISTNAFGSSAALAAVLDVIDDDDIIDEQLDWAMGINVDNEKPDNWAAGDPIPYMRPDVFGDPLHSRPVVINYGNDQIYIAVGTNQGALHLFKDEAPKSSIGQVTETWAFMPKELLPNIKTLRDNFSTSEKVYGVDGRITQHIVDHNGDGVVNTADGDEVWIFFGLRRGGNSYYGLNLTQPNNPKMMWKIKGGTTEFADLGQTWSQPKVMFSKLNISGSKAKPTLLFGGGYDINKDNSGIGSDDSVGKAVYMVDAKSGGLLWSTNSTKFTDSIPAKIGTLDSTGNGMVDRLYFGDTGGNIWRVDMPDVDTSKFSLFKLASFNDDTTNSGDIRFFDEATIVRAFITETLDSGKKDYSGNAIIVKQEVPYDAVLIGSGDESNPLGNDTDDIFYMIKDINIKTQEFTAISTPPMPVMPVTLSNLYDYTNMPFKGLTGAAFDAKALEVSLKSGWYFKLEQDGEKSTASAQVINNVVYFTTYTPPDLSVSNNSNTCKIASGASWLYAVDLALGINKFNWLTEDNDSGLNKGDHIKYINDQVLDTPTLIVNKSSPTSDPEGDFVIGRTVLPIGFTLQTIRNYLTVDE